MVGTRLQQDFGVLRQLRGATATTGMLVGGTPSTQLSQLYFHQQKKVGEVWGAGSMAGDSAALEPDPRAEGLK